ncbi:hypothetical protein BDZ90DRAFT_74743 [Jaminaea rosea]|uniref:Uncharacterized protein n=1 Tax=Jaminaea rosea TaxID=1569628 RepID=A0A316UQJ4_9BASI|nr:hypothetical protein BDZ90DRAFT_74743 [Jaminaea rosea]PWN25405.1 hypothetical protein BDZ90DRAFT_74743 [Jaminaea rosea]
MPRLERLRICDGFVERGAAHRIAGLRGELLDLREVEWDTGSSHWTGELLDVICALQGTVPRDPMRPLTQVSAVADARWLTDKAKLIAPRQIEVRLAPSMRDEVLEKSIRPDLRAAWTQGLPLSGTLHRLRLSESRAWRQDYYPTQPVENERAHFQQTDEWWRDCALYCAARLVEEVKEEHEEGGEGGPLMVAANNVLQKRRQRRSKQSQ